jgi:uncharacterized protein (TIGR03435 family)
LIAVVGRLLMKKSMPRTLILAALFAGTLLAQDITGTWQGTLAVPDAKREVRLVFKISKDAGGTRCIVYAIDQGPQGYACSVTVAGAAVKIAMPSITGSFEGKLDSDGVNLTGTFTQGGTLPLSLKHVKDESAWPIPEAPARRSMPADADPTFDVVSIKPADPDARGRRQQNVGREWHATNHSASSLIELSYGVQTRQIVGAPAWTETDKYNIVATPDLEGLPNPAQVRTMIAKMLADRFQLKFHREKKELPVYAIQVGKNGPKLTKSAGDPNAGYSLIYNGGNLPARNATMADFASSLQRSVLDRPVVDQTGLEGKWDFLLTWTREGNQMAALGAVPAPLSDNPNPDGPPDLVTAMRDQLGLNLISSKAMVELIVIDHIEKPAAN